VLQRKLPPWNLRSSTASEIGTEPGIEIPPLLNGGKPVLEGVHVAWRSALALQSSHFVLSQVAEIHSLHWFHYSKVMAK